MKLQAKNVYTGSRKNMAMQQEISRKIDLLMYNKEESEAVL